MDKIREVVVYLVGGEKLTFSPVDEVIHDSDPDVLNIRMEDWEKKVVIPFDSLVYYVDKSTRLPVKEKINL